MSVRGAMITVLATELANAVRADDADPQGHDIAAGIFGSAVSTWVRKTADAFIENTIDRQPKPELNYAHLTCCDLFKAKCTCEETIGMVNAILGSPSITKGKQK